MCNPAVRRIVKIEFSPFIMLCFKMTIKWSFPIILLKIPWLKNLGARTRCTYIIIQICVITSCVIKGLHSEGRN